MQCKEGQAGNNPKSNMELACFDYSKKIKEGQYNSGLFASKRSKTSHGVY
jgi:hypothetical protein